MLVRAVFRAAACLLVALATGACAGDSGPVWLPLARGFAPAPLSGERPLAPGSAYRVAPADGVTPGALWLGLAIPRSAWLESGTSGLWTTPRRLGSFEWLAEGLPARLESSARTFAYVPFSRDLGALADVPRGSFTRVHDELLLWLAEGDAPQGELIYRVLVERGSAAPAPGAGAPTWRVAFGRFSAEGLPVWPGERALVTCDVPPHSALRFATAALPVFGATRGDDYAGGSVRFRVRLGASVLFDERLELARAGVVRQHALELPADGGRSLELAFEVDGDAALAAFLAPVVGPARVGGFGARPWGGARGDVVLFLADTFRADNLSTYGGRLGLAPTIDALAARSLVFERTWSPSVWTLPSQGSMLSGLYPHQHGAIDNTRSLPAGARTIAEHLAAAGYRTVAITDAGFVSRRFGLDQGFEWFDERFRPLEDTLSEVERLLDADDGRPLFLFVHTYRVHRPYRVSSETRALHGERLGIDASDDDLLGLVLAQVGAPLDPKRPRERVDAPAAASLRALYHGAVLDLDRGFGRFLGALDARGLLASGSLVFTSDHGEAFGEHGLLGHEEGVWEEQIRIPLFVHGPGARAGRVPYAASLTDLPATLSALAGIAPNPRWEGASLLALEGDRPAFSFQCGWRDDRAMALVAGARKLVASATARSLERGELYAAFDLERDPLELTDQSGVAGGWPAELLARLAPRCAPLLVPAFDPSSAHVGPGDEEDLRMLGYLGGTDFRPADGRR